MTERKCFVFRFADVEVRERECLLIKAGERIPVEPKAFRVLLYLLRNPGRLIPKDEIVGSVWNDSAVSDNSLTRSIAQLRRVLGDDLREPLYILTVPTVGYRFLCEVSEEEDGFGVRVGSLRAETDKTDENRLHDQATVQGVMPLSLEKRLPEAVTSAAARTFETNTAAIAPKKRWLIPAALAFIAVGGLIAAGLYYLPLKSRQLTAKDTVVVADFDNKTGEAVFDDTLKTALTVALNQSPFLNVLSDHKVTATLKLMTRPADTKLIPDVAQELCQRAGSAAYIEGSIASLGSEYVIGLKAVSCRTGDTLAEKQVTANSKEHVLNAVGDAAAKLRSQLGESLPSVEKFDMPLEEATTSSLDALKALTTGDNIENGKGVVAAFEYYQRAIQLDPNFAVAYRAAGDRYVEAEQLELASKYYAKAFELRERASESERLYIIANYYLNVTGELDKSAQAYQHMIDSFPHWSEGYAGLSMVNSSLGQHESALQLAYAAQRIEPDNLWFDELLANMAMSLQHFDESRRAMQDAQARNFDEVGVRNARYGLFFLGSDENSIATERSWYANNPAFENYGLSLDSDTEAYAGHIAKARELTKRAMDSAIRADSRESGAIWWENAAIREAAMGNPAEARIDAAAGLKLYRESQAVQVEAALAYAMLGDAPQAQMLERDLDQRYPLNTQVQSLWLPAINAQIALNRRNTAEAIEKLQKALPPIEYGSVVFIVQASCLYPTYIRGQAYLSAGQGKEAAAEFQKVLDHSGMVWNCWTGALARLGVAHANALEIKASNGADAEAARERAQAAYRDFLTLWKEADADVPIYKQAKAEYAKLE
jgi:DNA-binding winged helix-turn-helix (wHTH) protein/tetratricopeptide (TPR) repeat protein